MRNHIPACFAFFVLACSALACSPASQPAQDAPIADARATSAPDIVISEAWAPPTPNGVDVGAVYLIIANETGLDDALISISSPRAERAEVHEMASEGAVMRMRAVERLALPAGQSVTLAPGGLHLMFHGLDHPFAAGESVPVRLVFEHAGPRELNIEVRARGEAHAGH